MKARTILFCFTLLFSASVWSSGGAAHGEEHGLPFSLLTHLANMSIFVAVIGWALLSKAQVPLKARELREHVKRDLQESKQQIETSQQLMKEIEQKLSQFSSDAEQLQKNARTQAETLLKQMRAETEVQVARLLNEAKASSENEVLRAKERVILDLVSTSIDAASTQLSETLDTRPHDATVKRHMGELEEATHV